MSLLMPVESFGRGRLRMSELQGIALRLRSLSHVVEREIERFQYEFSTRDRFSSFEFPMLLIYRQNVFSQSWIDINVPDIT